MIQCHGMRYNTALKYDWIIQILCMHIILMIIDTNVPHSHNDVKVRKNILIVSWITFRVENDALVLRH